MEESKGKSEAQGSRGVESVARALDLLDALAERERGLVDLARAAGLKAPTAHRLLATLVAAGYARRTGSGNYALGPSVLRLGTAINHDTEEFLTVVGPFVDRVHRVAGATTNLFVRDQDHPVLLDQRPAPEASEVRMEIGAKLPAHATASGKAMLAFAPGEMLERVLGGAPLDAYTPRTITQPERLRLELRTIRERGFSMGYREYADRTTGIAAPIFDAGGTVVGALGVSLVNKRRPRIEEVAALGELVGCAAIEASGELGYEGPSPWFREAETAAS
jgi:IclR family transcriptional regulator, acetate operon repressor